MGTGVIFKNPPLIELVAEIRWLPAGTKVSENDPVGVDVSAAFLSSSDGSDVAMRFAALVGAEGFQRIESLYPPGMPALPYQLRHRYRRTDTTKNPELYQLGHGIFTANMIPPYTSWSAFRPIVQRGITYILKAHEDKPIEKFIVASLRYIDCFTAEFTEGRTTRLFMQDILGVELKLPAAIESHVAKGGEARPNIQVQIPLQSGHHATIKLAEGRAGDRDGVLMDTTVVWRNQIDANADAVMTLLDGAHHFIHKSFLELTAKLQDKMRPK